MTILWGVFMSLGKKIGFLFVSLIVLTVYTVATFDYKVITGETKNEEIAFLDTKTIIEYTNEIREKAYLMKDDLLKKMGVLTEEERIVEESVNLDEANHNEQILVKKLTANKPSMVDEIEDNVKDNKSNDNITDNITKTNENEVKNTEILEEKIDKNQEISKNIENPEKNDEKIIKTSENTDISNTIQNPKQIQFKINEILAQNKISFKRRSVKITKESFESVKKVADILKENKDLNVEIAGHTDSRGKASLNKRISQDRANSVKAALVKLGVEKKRLKAVGYGEQFPVAKDDKDGLSEINRRVEINIEGVEK